PRIDPERNLSMYKALIAAMDSELVRSAHDCSDGGLATAIVECCFGIGEGCIIDLDSLANGGESLNSWTALFSESLGRIIVSVQIEDCEAFEKAMKGHAISNLGVVGGPKKVTFKMNDKSVCQSTLTALLKAWKGTLHMGGDL
ncbi:MAG TPA: phosphoribosylformylglycinamidine synthase, partial [Myxococcales bacterium]|nr:phosphoribosylformylglycinamidine synthase [Myxococcales bacterium]